MSLRTGVPASYREQVIDEYRGNPMIEALPDIRAQADAATAMLVRPPFNPDERQLPIEYRWHLLGRLKQIVVPRPSYYAIERTVSRLIRAGYVLRNPMQVETWRQVYNARDCAAEAAEEVIAMPTGRTQLLTADSKATIVGLSGIGKTTAMDAVLRTYPDQVIRHEVYQGHRLPVTQIVWLKVTCPETGSISSFCREFARQLDTALGVKKYERMYTRSKLTRDELEGMMRQHAATYFLGLLVIDEIQRLKLAKTKGAKGLLDFLQDLRDSLRVPSLLIGTYKAISLFENELKDARRASESGLIDLVRPTSHEDGEWTRFVNRLWSYQWTHHPRELDDEMLRTLFDLTQGVTDLVVILFKLAQQRAMLEGTETVDVACIKATYDEQLQLLHPALNALRKNTHASLASFEDLLPPNRALMWSAAPPTLDEQIDAKLDDLMNASAASAPATPLGAPASGKKPRHRKMPLSEDDIRTAEAEHDAYDALMQSGVIGTDDLFDAPEPSTHADGSTTR